MKMRLDERILIPGDIAFTTTDAVVSRAIRKFTSSAISHAMLCVTHSSIIHADSDGVHAENTQRIFFKPTANIFVRRLTDGLPAEDARKICDHVRTIVGTEYSVREAMRVMARGRRAVSTKQFCSRLIAQAYRKFGYDLVGNADFCSPQQLLESKRLSPVANATNLVSEDEFKWYKQARASPDETKRATNQILSAARNIDRSIQTFDDVNRLVIQKPNFDIYIAGIYKSSGYLDLWKMEYEGDLSWRIDIREMDAIEDTIGVSRYCMSTMAGEARDDNRFTTNLANLKHLHNRYPRQLFLTLIILYERLVDLHARRYDTAQEWLRRHP